MNFWFQRLTLIIGSQLIKKEVYKLISLIAKITLLLIGSCLVLFGCITNVKDKPSLLVGKIIPVMFGIYIIIYASYYGG